MTASRTSHHAVMPKVFCRSLFVLVMEHGGVTPNSGKPRFVNNAAVMGIAQHAIPDLGRKIHGRLYLLLNHCKIIGVFFLEYCLRLTTFTSQNNRHTVFRTLTTFLGRNALLEPRL